LRSQQDRSILIYTSDNGTAVTAKTRAVERGCRVPFIAYGASIKQRGSTMALTDLSDILPTLLDFAGASLPTGYAIDGKSLKPFLTGQTDTHREWIFSNIATSRLLRTQRYLLEAVNPLLELPEGRLYDCGDSRNGRGYRRISDPTERAQVLEHLQPILDRYPALTADHPYWTSKRGKAFLQEYTSRASMAKHLHNHRDYQFYDEE